MIQYTFFLSWHPLCERFNSDMASPVSRTRGNLCQPVNGHFDGRDCNIGLIVNMEEIIRCTTFISLLFFPSISRVSGR